MARPIYEIAADIRRDWSTVNYGAVPYLAAMQTLTGIDEMYHCDTARSVVAYFLANAQTWRGEVARRVKKELKELAS